ncbi:recombinase family protein [Roseomonas sp. GCM10028921]
MADCRLRRCTLLIAKLDRLARDAYFLLGLEKAGVEFLTADMPYANRLTIGVTALVAEEEPRATSSRKGRPCRRQGPRCQARQPTAQAGRQRDHGQREHRLHPLRAGR